MIAATVPGFLREALQKVDTAVRAGRLQLQNDLAARAEAKKQRTALDDLEDKVTASTAVAAAASGSPEQAKAALGKIRAKAMRAAADGADTRTLEAMVRQMERLAKIAEKNREREKDGGRDAAATAIPVLDAIPKL